MDLLKPGQTTKRAPHVGLSSPLVSVVTPFYNTGLYLRECIESVLRQSHANFEYLLVNNCSTDNSRAIAEEFAKQDPRVRLINNETFLGKVENYNHALRQISPAAEYCKIVQADDWVFDDCLEKMVRLAESDPKIGLVSSYFMLGKRIQNVGLPFPDAVFGGRDICRMQLLDGKNFFFGNYTTVMVRSEIVRSRDPYYALDTYNDDTESCYEALKHWKFGFVHQVLSFTREGNESLSKSMETFRPELPDYLIAIKKYGPWYLTEEELAHRIKDVEGEYFRYLGHAALVRREPKFWEFHREGLKVAGYDLNKGTIAKHGLLEAVRLATRPWRLVRRLFR